MRRFGPEGSCGMVGMGKGHCRSASAVWELQALASTAGRPGKQGKDWAAESWDRFGRAHWWCHAMRGAACASSWRSCRS